MDTPAPGYGIREHEGDGAAAAVHAERIRATGYTVLDGCLAPSELPSLRSRLDDLLERQSREFGDMQMAAIGDSHTVRCPLVYDEEFLRLAARPEILALVRRLLGDYVVLMQQNGVINPPGISHTQAAYHRDLPYQHFTSSRPLGVSALVCLDPFRVETGATVVLPASHRVEGFPSTAAAAAMATTVEADPGSVIVFDSMLFHRAGENSSSHKRRAVNHVFTLPVIAQQISLPDALEGRHAGDPNLRRLLGYETAPARSVEQWRRRRLERSRVVAP